mmetsp:Transcript_9770/g.22718  ORF Transcript_9770/g.22718 Transcript_9770/m.22718 type:complete len:233 (+) Transcript_9770:95-793(+)
MMPPSSRFSSLVRLSKKRLTTLCAAASTARACFFPASAAASASAVLSFITSLDTDGSRDVTASPWEKRTASDEAAVKMKSSTKSCISPGFERLYMRGKKESMSTLSNHLSARRFRCIPTLAPSSTEDFSQWFTSWFGRTCAKLISECASVHLTSKVLASSGCPVSTKPCFVKVFLTILLPPTTTMMRFLSPSPLRPRSVASCPFSALSSSSEPLSRSSHTRAFANFSSDGTS